MTTVGRPTAADDYLAAVATALDGVPDAERQELLDDLADHLAELAAEDGETLEDRLGPPAAYAAELVSSAGIEVPVDTGPPPPALPLWRRTVAGGQRLLSGPSAQAVRAFLPELRPGWWVLRAWAALVLLATVGGNDRLPLPDALGNGFLSLLLLGGAVVASVHLGRGGPWPDRIATWAGVLGVLVALGQSGTRIEYVGDETSYDIGTGFLVGPDGQVVENIWPFDAEGQPLEGVFLFDQFGNPISLGESRDPAAVTVPGLFPQDQTVFQYDERTGIERQVPAEAPEVSVPRIPVASTTSTTSTSTTSTTSTTATLPPEPTATTATP